MRQSDNSEQNLNELPTEVIENLSPNVDEFPPVFAIGVVYVEAMGELIVLAERRADRSRPTRSMRPAFFFDLSCPFSYLTAERVERVLGDVDWVPTAATVLHRGGEWDQPAAVRAHAETCAVALRLPLVWPDRFPTDAPTALRAAAQVTLEPLAELARHFLAIA